MKSKIMFVLLTAIVLFGSVNLALAQGQAKRHEMHQKRTAEVTTRSSSVRNEIPTVDSKKTCQLEAAESTAPAQDLDSCLRDQQSAREELAKQWGTFAASDKELCLNMATKGYLPSYVELLTCVETFKYAKMPSTESATPTAALPPGQRQPRARQ